LVKEPFGGTALPPGREVPGEQFAYKKELIIARLGIKSSKFNLWGSRGVRARSHNNLSQAENDSKR
jgi:hypothetical protein